jgi:hypothetical protein
MQIDRKLNLVIPIDGENGTLWVHSQPIPSDVFKRYFMLMGKAFASIWTEGLQVVSGPRLAAMIIRNMAEQMGLADEVERGLLAEIWRLSNVLILSENGWEPVTLEQAKSRKLIALDDLEEVEGAICFFILASALHRKKDLPQTLNSMRLWGAQPTSLSLTEFKDSLPISTPYEDFGTKTTQSSIPS